MILRDESQHKRLIMTHYGPLVPRLVPKNHIKAGEFAYLRIISTPVFLRIYVTRITRLKTGLKLRYKYFLLGKPNSKLKFHLSSDYIALV